MIMKYLEFAKTQYSNMPAGFIFSGEDIYFLSEGMKKVKALVNVDNPQLNIDVCENFQDFFFALESMPFLSEYRLVIFTYADFSDKDGMKKLKEYLKNPNPTSVFVLTCEKAVKTAFDCEMIYCGKENDAVLAKWVGVKLRQSDKIISDKNAREIVSRCRGDMSKISKETEKLSFLDGVEITESDIDNNCEKELEKVVFKLTDAIADKNGALARALLFEMESELTIFQIQGMLFKMFQRMFFVRTSGKSNGEIAQIIGIKEYAVKILSQKATKFSKMKLKNAVEYLESVDSKIKSGNMSQNGCIEDMILFLMK